MRCGIFILMLGLLLAGVSAVMAQNPKDTDVTVITSDMLTFDYNKKYALFQGKVVVVDPRMKIYADKMNVTFDENNKAKNIKAEGNVIIIQEDKRARGATAEYKIDSGEIALSGNPMITQGKNIFTADVIRFWRDENRIEGKPNTRLVIYPEGDNSSAKLFMEPKRD